MDKRSQWCGGGALCDYRFCLHDKINKIIFDYETLKSEPHQTLVKNINPYLVEGAVIILQNRNQPICLAPKIGIGNKPIDDGLYLFTQNEKEDFLLKEPHAEKYFRRWLGADEFLNGFERWCLWVGNCAPDLLNKMPEVLKRVEAVRYFRLKSKSLPTQKLAAKPTRFHVENIPDSNYLIVPRVSSERRHYIPIGFMSAETICGDTCLIVTNATVFDFGILTSKMHMAWVRSVCGRLKSDYRYSAGIVYNNFPWPEATDKQRLKIEKAGQGVLDIREKYPKSTLAELYNPTTMPPDLVKAHDMLDKAVDEAYGKTSFKNEAERVAFLFECYQKITAPLGLEIKSAKPKKSTAKKSK